MPILLFLDDAAHPPPLPRIVPITAPAAQPVNILGCGIASADIFTRGAIKRVLDLPNITSVEWGRANGDTSDATVQLDGQAIASNIECCAIMQTIRPWQHELHIYRDGLGAWSGPIVEMTLEGQILLIKARDLSAWYDRRFIHSSHSYGGQNANQGSVDAETIFLDITTDAILSDASPLNGSVQLFTITDSSTALATFPMGGGIGGLVARTYSPGQFKPCGPEMRDLAKNHLTWTVINRVGYVNAASKWIQVLPNPVVNPRFDVNISGWSSGIGASVVRDTTVFHTSPASMALGAGGTLDVDGSIVGLTVGQRYLMTCWMRGTSSAFSASAAAASAGDGVIKVGNDESDGISWALYGQNLSLVGLGNNPGRDIFVPVGVFFTATATTMPIKIAQSGLVDTAAVYFDDFAVWQQIPSFTLRDNHLAVPPKITLSGLDQSTRTIVTTKQGGTDGDVGAYSEQPKPAWASGGVGPPGGVKSAAQIQYGLLEVATTLNLNGGSSTGSAASQRAATLEGTPILIDSLTLSPAAGVTMAQLIPGCLFVLRLDEPCFAIQAQLILQTVSVKTTPAGGEQVTVTFQPTGF